MEDIEDPPGSELRAWRERIRTVEGHAAAPLAAAR